jgi:hypothetical protein
MGALLWHAFRRARARAQPVPQTLGARDGLVEIIGKNQFISFSADTAAPELYPESWAEATENHAYSVTPGGFNQGFQGHQPGHINQIDISHIQYHNPQSGHDCPEGSQGLMGGTEKQRPINIVNGNLITRLLDRCRRPLDTPTLGKINGSLDE